MSLPCIGDGRQSGTSGTPSILNASPEAAAGGGLALLQTGDRIRIDLNKRTADILICAGGARRSAARTSRPAAAIAYPASQTPWQEIQRGMVDQLVGGHGAEAGGQVPEGGAESSACRATTTDGAAESGLSMPRPAIALLDSGPHGLSTQPIALCPCSRIAGAVFGGVRWRIGSVGSAHVATGAIIGGHVAVRSSRLVLTVCASALGALAIVAVPGLSRLAIRAHDEIRIGRISTSVAPPSASCTRAAAS